MDKQKEFEKIAEILDKIECPIFALWYLLPKINEVLERNSYGILSSLKANDLKKAAEEMREVLSNELW